jgi:hypothetical protein
MTDLADEFKTHGESLQDDGLPLQGGVWVEASQELRATADQALTTNTVAEKLVKGD